MTTASALDGIERIYRFRHVSPYPVHVAYGYETAAVRREFQERMLPSLLSTGLACALVVLLSGFAARSVAERQKAEISAEAARLGAESQRQAAKLGEELKIALDGARLAPFERNLATGEGRWTERIRELYGVGPELERNSVEDWMRIIHPDDRARVMADLRSAGKGHPGTPTTGSCCRTARSAGSPRAATCNMAPTARRRGRSASASTSPAARRRKTGSRTSAAASSSARSSPASASARSTTGRTA